MKAGYNQHMSGQIYIIGHVNPDTDTIATAMGYAWLLRERDEVNVDDNPITPENENCAFLEGRKRNSQPWVL
jgi:nanoRNase/pAp phosphatase (c-di-AMP/oligoRNAs hydrolase)